MNCIELRHKLHQYPELSNEEHSSAKHVASFMASLKPDKLIEGLGGTGVAACFGDSTSGKVIMLRCELDALPIIETNNIDYKSKHHGVSHKCGHDGHMAILAAVATYYAKHRPSSGQVVLLFQPAEETGEGAKNVLNDSFDEHFSPDYVFALHNAPKHPMGEVIIKSGTMCCASRGLIIRFNGKTAHAAQPETGVSPIKAVYKLLPLFETLPSLIATTSPYTFATVVGVSVGEKAFGTAPACGEVYVTLRSESNREMQLLLDKTYEAAQQLATQYELTCDIECEDVFDATVNHDEAVDIISHALSDEPLSMTQEPFRWSEDFGQFTQKYCGALFGLGAGESTPALHNPDYDFPDELIDIGQRYFVKITNHCLSERS